MEVRLQTLMPKVQRTLLYWLNSVGGWSFLFFTLCHLLGLLVCFVDQPIREQLQRGLNIINDHTVRAATMLQFLSYVLCIDAVSSM